MIEDETVHKPRRSVLTKVFTVNMKCASSLSDLTHTSESQGRGTFCKYIGN